jgi:hypothetical protein
VGELSSPPFHQRVMTFSDTPLWHVTDQSTLKDKVNKLENAHWNGSTNLRSAFNLILETALVASVPPSDMPKTLYIFSDMQFDAACRGDNNSTFEYARTQFAQHDYQLPGIVFWNLNGDHSGTPITMSENNTALVSGFSPTLLKLLMKGKLDPMGIMEEAISHYTADIDEQE